MSDAPLTLTLPLLPLTREAFAPFGQAVPRPTGAPTSFGESFDCWFGVGTLHGADLRLGQVVARRPCDGRITAMERHPDIEMLMPATGPLIQVVAPGRDLGDARERPCAEEAVAFLIEPGEAVVVAPGVWHAAALPAAGETLYWFAGLPHAPEPGRQDWPWIAFAGGAGVRLQD
jgi:ureidoglycolate hydrolase